MRNRHDSPGGIWIIGLKEDDRIRITLSDDGVGMSDGEMDQLNEELRDCYVQSDRHIGVRNVNQRLKLIFGEEYGITLSVREQFPQYPCYYGYLERIRMENNHLSGCHLKDR